VTLALRGHVTRQSLHHQKAWQRAGFGVISVVVVESLDAFKDADALAFAAGILVRENRGHDFGAWASAIRQLGPGLRRTGILALANDSVLGPLNAFEAMLQRVRASRSDVIGLTDSHEHTHHLQSYVLFFKRRAIRSRAFRRFWLGVRTGDRTFVIEHYELALLRHMQAGGLRCRALFPGFDDKGPNPTLCAWRDLVDAGFPYVKAQLIRSNPFKADIRDWERVLTVNGYDPALVHEVLPAAGSGPDQTSGGDEPWCSNGVSQAAR
jgi:lipopolysaccharide biosynthesis protein